ncbi:hypothetical protein E4U53_004336 [Claviceps sorghi]|nr:hypothetical protein E4U53_004336 [Claviceps sorghi]
MATVLEELFYRHDPSATAWSHRCTPSSVFESAGGRGGNPEITKQKNPLLCPQSLDYQLRKQIPEDEPPRVLRCSRILFGRVIEEPNAATVLI